MQKQYFLSFDGSHIGPYSVEVILKRVASKQTQWTDYVYDETANEWVMLLEHPEFCGKNLPAVEPAASTLLFNEVDKNLKGKDWYLLKGGNNYGPFSKIELVQMLQEKKLFEYDYIWQQGMVGWKRLSEVAEFTPEKIRDLKESGQAEVAEVFFRRRHARAKYGTSLIIHNNKHLFRGKSIEISAGGAGLLIDNQDIQPGQSLFLHFQPGDGVPPFNAVCQVVSKNFYRDSKAENLVKYGVRFTSVSQQVRETIHSYTAKAA